MHTRLVKRDADDRMDCRGEVGGWGANEIRRNFRQVIQSEGFGLR